MNESASTANWCRRVPACALLVVTTFLLAACNDSSSMPETRLDLRLVAGASTAETEFDAVDPRTHTQTIEVTVEPGDASATIDFTTADGGTLHVLTDGDAANCDVAEGKTICTIRFPILEARTPGRWTVNASKPDGPAANISLHLRWDPVDS